MSLVWVAALWLAAAPARSWWGRGAQDVEALQAQYNAGRYESVITQLDPVGLQRLRGHSLRRGYILLGASYEKAGHPDRALGVYQVGARLFPRDQELLTRLAQLMHSSGLDEQAQPLYEHILKVNSDNPYAHLGLAEIDRTLGFLDRSAEHYERALEGLSDRAGIWQDYAELLYQARDYRTAELAVRRAQSLDSKDTSTLDLALILRELGRADEALAELEPLAKAGNVGAIRARALWLMESGRDEQARTEVEALERQAPGDALALYVRARLELKAGRKAQALDELRLAAQGKESPFTVQVCEKLADLLQAPPPAR